MDDVISQHPPYRGNIFSRDVTDTWDFLSDPKAELFLRFLQKVWPKVGNPIQQIGESNAAYQTRCTNLSTAWDAWIMGIVTGAFATKTKVNPPFMFDNAPPNPHIWPIPLEPNAPVPPGWPDGNYQIMDWCHNNDFNPPIKWNGYNTRIEWEKWYNSDTFLENCQHLIDTCPAFTNLSVDYTYLGDQVTWAYGGKMNTIYPDAWDSRAFPPLAQDDHFGLVKDFPDPLFWCSPFDKNHGFPAPTPTNLCPCPDKANMSIMKKIGFAMERLVMQRIPLPVNDPTLWPSDTEMYLFLETYYEAGLLFTGFKGDKQYNFPPSWKTYTMACMINVVCWHQALYVFQPWSTQPDPDDVSGFFVGLGEFSNEVKQYFIDNPIDRIHWQKPTGNPPIYGLSELIGGLNINDIVYSAFTHLKDGSGFFFRPNEIQAARALVEPHFFYNGPFAPPGTLMMVLPSILEFWRRYVGHPWVSQRVLQDFAMVISLQIIYACQNEIAQGKNPYIPPDHIDDWHPKYPIPELEKLNPNIKRLGELWRTNYSGSLFHNSYDLFGSIELVGEPQKYSIARFMVANPLPMVLNPGLWYEFKKWLGFIKTDNEREILMNKQWDAYVEWCIKNVFAMKAADENPQAMPYVKTGDQLYDKDGNLKFVTVKGSPQPLYNTCPDFGILDQNTSHTPMIFKVFGGIWYQLLGDNLWGFVRGILSEVIDLMFAALDLIGKVIQTVVPSFLLLALGVGVFMIGLTYFEERAKTKAEEEEGAQRGTKTGT